MIGSVIMQTFWDSKINEQNTFLQFVIFQILIFYVKSVPLVPMRQKDTIIQHIHHVKVKVFTHGYTLPSKRYQFISLLQDSGQADLPKIKTVINIT